ncbi:MAG: RluA family pseudouridine synthase [Dehalococcoidia bacterium]|nr:RluA family pseudouridine synthase [Dehalococcoidia bacterium]
MDRPKQLVVDHGSKRLDCFVAEHSPEFSRSFIQKLIAEGWITVNAQPAKPALRLKTGDRVVIATPPPEPSPLAPEHIPLDIIYEDADLIVINKPSGMTTHPAPGNRAGTLVNALLGLLPELTAGSAPERPGIVHRLDKDTSGLIVVAKHRRALEDLSGQFKSRRVEKTYLALVKGHPEPEAGLIDAPIGRNPVHHQRMAVVSSGRPAQTAYRVRRRLGGYTLLTLKPATGRTHQIRVHLAGIGHPVVGDAVYGIRSELVARQFLHAYKLTFRLPSTGTEATFTAPLPTDLGSALETLVCGGSRIEYNR